MQPAHFLPPHALKPYISFYGIAEVAGVLSEPYLSPPLGLCGFILCLKGNIDPRLNGSSFLRHRYCATGQVTGPMMGEIKGNTKVLMVFIQPFGLHQLFGIDMSSLTDTSMPLNELLSSEEYDALIERLNSAADNGQMIAVMNAFFLSQQPVFEIAPKVKQSIDYIHRLKGNVTVKDMERNCFITPRSLERHFKVCVGLSPKEYAKIYRFKCLINYIKENPGVTWTVLCEQNGYYDQAHLSRYFTRYLKIKPGELVTLDMNFINYLLQD